MLFTVIRKLTTIFIFIVLLSTSCFASLINNPCGDPASTQAIANRPTYADSACVVPFKHAVLEMGYTHQKLMGNGYQHNFPEAEFRLGLPANNELFVWLPEYDYQTVAPSDGWSTYVVGIKHEFGFTEHWLFALEGMIAPASGSYFYGTKRMGATGNALIEYSFNPRLTALLQLGANVFSESAGNGGKRFFAITPDLVLSWQANPKTLLFLEVFGISKVSPTTGAGFNGDTGVTYQLNKNWVIDAEYGQRFSGSYIGFDHYFGTGLTIQF